MNKLFTGFALGLIVGVLFAPSKGTETRKKIVEKGADLKNQFADFIDDIANRFEDADEEAEGYAEVKSENLSGANI
jgi:gas vesicle protein